MAKPVVNVAWCEGAAKMLAESQRSGTRTKLMDSAVCIIANEGYHRATTKNIATRAGLNEVYIYRLFGDKEDLISKAFGDADEHIAYAIEKALPLLRLRELSWEDRCRALFMRAYEQMLVNNDCARFYVRYYYSEQFRTYAMAKHSFRYEKLRSCLAEYFKPGENTEYLLRFAFEAIMDLVFRVASGDVKKTPDAAEQLFTLVYRAMAPSFRDALEG